MDSAPEDPPMKPWMRYSAKLVHLILYGLLLAIPVSANMYSTRRFIALDEKTFRLLFRISLLLKAAFSLLEIVGGILAYFISQQYLLRLVTMATQEELTEDPRDFVAQFLVQSAQQLSVSSQHFAAFYLLSHGIIKTVLIVGLLRERLSYYPLSMLVFGIFVAYQLFRFQFTHSVWLMAITILDIVVIAMTWHEYQFLRRSIRTPTKA